MKKLLAIVLALLMLLAVFAACGKKTTTDNAPETTPTSPEEQTTQQGEVPLTQELVDKAASMIYEFYKPGSDNSVSASFSLPAATVYEGYTMDINWEVEGGNGLVNVLTGQEKNKATIQVDASGAGGEFKLKGTVSCGEFSSPVEFTYKIIS